jgi:flagellar basal body P-ring formation protein FlgA
MRVFFPLSLGFAFALLPAAGAAETETIIVKLRPMATASGTQVTVGDIADLRGVKKGQRESIARLDVAELPLSSQPIFVSQQQIGFRLQLAGFTAYRLEGPRYVRVSRPAGEDLEAKIAAVARQALEDNLAGAVKEVSIQLAHAVTLPPLSADGADIHLEAEVRSPVLPPCRVGVEVSIYVRGARRNGVIVFLDVQMLQPVAVAISRIDIGEAFTTDNVRWERMAVENTQRAAVAAAGLMGRRARRPVSAGHALEPDDVELDTPAAIIIHPSNLVHLIATVGPMQIKTEGEALQSGRVGQLIQVRNLESKNTVTGRVIDRSTVEVEY